MNNPTSSALLLCLVLVGGVATVASPPQDSTAFPGQSTKARVWIQNQGKTEAVPMTLQGVAPDVAPLSVQVSGTPTVRIDAGIILPVRAVRQRWEYRSVTIGPADDPAIALNTAGDDGWETTGLTFPGRAGTTVVLKRPR